MTVLVEARDLRCTLRDALVLDGVDLCVEAGSVHALIGLNGAGKTTLLRLLLGMLPADSGAALVHGVPARTAPATIWRDVGHVIGAAGYSELTARQNLVLAARLQGLARVRTRARIAELAQTLRFAPWLDRRLGTCSWGTRVKVAIAGALLHEPRVLLLDEPTNGLDPLGVVAVRGLVRAAANEGAAVLVSSHHLDELARMADRMSVLHRGRFVGHLDPTAPDPGRRLFDLLLSVDTELAEAMT